MEVNPKKPEGIIFINKPRGITSHDVVDVVRGRLKIRKVGHAGTLDPLAEGLLIVLVGNYTKLFPKFVGFDKEYAGILKLGQVTSTGDSQGQIISESDFTSLSEEDVRETFALFQGEMDQIPPMVSAVRVKGNRLYNLARKGITIKRSPRKINIYKLTISKINFPFVEFIVHCSKGTYVRKLAEDIGEKLGCGAHMTKILRLKIGEFKLEEAVDLEHFDQSHLKQITL